MVIVSTAHSEIVQGASYYINEVKESKKVVKRVEQLCNEMKKGSIITYEETKAKNQKDNLKNIVNFHNSKSKDLNISIHFNSATFKGVNHTDSEVGIEVYYCSEKGKKYAQEYLNKIVSISGLKNRGIKLNKKLTFLNDTIGASILIELCFVNSKKDVEIYNKKFEDICIGIAELITGTTYNKKNDVKKGYYQVVTQSFSIKENAIKYQNELKAKGISSFLQYKEV